MSPINVLLIEDNPGDVRLIQESFKESKIPNTVDVVADGIEALDFLYKRGKYSNKSRPHLILLDLNLPKKDGREVLSEIKSNPDLRKIPTVVLTSSSNRDDIVKSYDKHANCFIAKPIGLEEFDEMMGKIEQFWLETAKLPNGNH